MLLTVITVNLNNKEGLLRTIKSVATQTYAPIEYIVIDGGSKDGSLEVIKEHDAIIGCYVNEPDDGIYNAMNKGIALSNGDYLLFLNSGDTFYSKNSLAHLMAANANNNFDLIYGNIEVKGTRDYIKKYPEKLDYDYFKTDTLPHPATLIKATKLRRNLFDESLKVVSDWKFFMIGVLKENFTYKYIDRTISIFHTDGLSSNNTEFVALEKTKVLKEEFYLRGLIKKLKINYLGYNRK